MRGKVMKKVILMLLLAVLFLSCSKEKGPGPDGLGVPPVGGNERPMMGGPGPVFGKKGHYRDGLKLSDEQEEKFREINQKYWDLHGQLQKTAQPHLDELREVLLEEEIDYDKVREVLAKLSDYEIEKQIMMIKHRIELESVLSDEQLKKLKQHPQRK